MSSDERGGGWNPNSRAKTSLGCSVVRRSMMWSSLGYPGVMS